MILVVCVNIIMFLIIKYIQKWIYSKIICSRGEEKASIKWFAVQRIDGDSILIEILGILIN